jgi:hypothetical protein
MKEAIHERDSSIRQSLLSIPFLRCSTSYWLGHRCKMGTLRNRGICALLGDGCAGSPRHCNCRIGWHQRVQGCNAREKQGWGAADTRPLLPQPGRGCNPHPRNLSLS